MTVNILLKAALEPVAPVEADTYEGTEPTYITFGYISTPTDFGDDEPEHELFSISVHLFAPTGEDTIEKKAAGDRQILAKQLNISPYQLSYVTNSGEGEGLLFYGTTIIPFKDKFDKNLKLYSLMTTKPEEVEKREKEMEAEKHEGNR